jgi:hypothetical protein
MIERRFLRGFVQLGPLAISEEINCYKEKEKGI